MRHDKYLLAEYWKSKVNQNEAFWSGLFENKPIQRESVIIQPGILNLRSNQAEDAWAVYPNPQCVLGFLKFMYLPTAFIGLIEEETENQYYFAENFEELLDDYKEVYPDKVELLEKMQDYYLELDYIWDIDNDRCFMQLDDWARRFSNDWQDENGIVLMFNIFKSPKETMDFIIDSYEGANGIASLEQDLGFKKDVLLQISGEEIYSNDFMKRKFADLLTDRIVISV